jgi:hypothetical protein
MAQTGTPANSYRDAIRWGMLIAAVAVTGYRLPRAFGDFRSWRSALKIDPSAADFYQLSFRVDLVGIAIVLCVGLGAFYLLRSSATNRQ